MNSVNIQIIRSEDLHWRTKIVIWNNYFLAAPFFVDANCPNSNDPETRTIRSPNHPSAYPGDESCSWSIEVPIGAKVKIDRFSYSIHPGAEENRCKFDKLMIYDGSRSSSTIKALLCEDKTYDGIVSSENTLFLEFKSGGASDDKYNGFQFTFSVIGTRLYLKFTFLLNHTTWEI